MAQQTINVGTAPNDGTGTPLRTAFQYTNSNFSELYTAVGPSGNNIVVPGSATITGDLTVDTSTLKVDSANNRVGIGTAAPISLAQFSGATPTIALSDTNPSSGSFFNLLFRHTDGLSATYNIATIQGQTNGNGGNGNLLFFTAASNSNTERYKIASDGVATWSNVGGVAGTAMTLNSTGLGIGTASPATKLHIDTLSAGYGLTLASSSLTGRRFQFGINIDANLAIYDTSAAAVRMIIDGSGNCGIGVTPSAWGGSYKALQLQSVARNIAATGAGSGDFTVAFNAIYDSTDSRWEYAGTGDKAGRYSQTGSGNHRWFVSNTAGTAGNEITDFASPAMTLDADGNLYLKTTSRLSSGVFSVAYVPGTSQGAVFQPSTDVSSPTPILFLNSSGSAVGSITTTASATAYNISSDYRLKESVQPLVGGLTRISALKPSIYKWKADGSSGEGFLAHELAEVVPLAVTGEKDAVNDDGSIKAQGVDLSKVVPVLVAAIQELTARVQTLETR